MTVLPKDPAILDCQAHGHPPVAIKWLKNGVHLAESEHIQLLPNGSLYIPKIKHTKEESDEGFYQCLSKNKFGAILSQRSRLTIASKYWPLKNGIESSMRQHSVYIVIVASLWVINLEMYLSVFLSARIRKSPTQSK